MCASSTVSSSKPAVTPVEVRVSGPDIERLRSVAEDAKDILAGTLQRPSPRRALGVMPMGRTRWGVNGRTARDARAPQILPWIAASAIAACAIAAPGAAAAGEIQAALGAGGAASDWRGDGAVYSSVKVGYRGWDVIAPYFLLKVGYASVDQRLVTMLSLGAQVWGRIGPVRPYVRVGAVHQHEEPAAAVRANPWGALFGIGDGIRHRGGVEGGLGFDLPLRRWKKVELYLAAEASAAWLTWSSGPSAYWGGGLAVGVSYTL
jgi:hypothetical protein